MKKEKVKKIMALLIVLFMVTSCVMMAGTVAAKGPKSTEKEEQGVKEVLRELSDMEDFRGSQVGIEVKEEWGPSQIANAVAIENQRVSALNAQSNVDPIVNILWTHLGAFRAVAVGDLNGDARDDIVAVINDYNEDIYTLRAFNGLDGSVLWSSDALDGCGTNLAIGDIDGDGRNEVVTGDWDYAYAFEHDGTLKWSLDDVDYIIDMAIGDLNGENEVVFAHGSGTTYGTTAVYGTNGTVWWSSEYYCAKGVAIGDIDGDGDNEVVSGGNDDYATAYDGDGTFLWEYSTGGEVQVIRIADLNGDGTNEIIVGCSSGYVYALNESGDEVWTWEEPSGYCISMKAQNLMGIGDLDGDGKNDIAFGVGYDSGGIVYALKGGDGTELWNYTTGGGCIKGTVVGDVNCDSVNEVAVVTGYYDEWARVCIFDNEGNLLWDFDMPEDNCARTIAIGDIDRDGTEELVVGTGPYYEVGYLYTIDFPKAKVPALTPVGIIALIGLLSVVAAISIVRKREGK